MALHNSILDTVGRTPIVRINNLAPAGINLYAKLESFNPMGSVKDRLALGIIEAAERSGDLKPGQTVIEATSGNTGIGLALVCAQKRYPLVIVMSESFSIDRRKLMRFLGAKVVLTPAAARGTGMVQKTQELAELNGWFLCRQFENQANPDFHSKTTAREILDDFSKSRLDYWVTGYGTGGTLKGVARILKKESPLTKIVVCEPENSPLLSSGIRPDGMSSHPKSHPHPIQGWTPDFIPRIAAEAVADGLIDRLLPVSGHDALRWARDLARLEGIFCGVSGGATFTGALEVCKGAPQGSTVLCMIPDTGERYLSTPLFENVPQEMTEEELAISRSTPSARFDQPTAAKPAATIPPAPLDPEASKFVDDALSSTDHKVVIFALEWCEFCGSVRKALVKYGIPYHSIDLDSVKFQQNNLGTKIRPVLAAKAGNGTIPQVFVGGELVGGARDTLSALKSGQLQQLLERHSVPYNRQVTTDPETFLPAWIYRG